MNSPAAKYTETFYEFIKNNPNYLASKIILSSEERSQKLIDMLISCYNVYEIGSETEDLFKLNFEDIFNIWKDFYEEKITAYTKEYDYSISNRRRVIHTKDINLKSNKSLRSGTDNKYTEIELPNKKISDNYEEIPSSITRDDNRRSDDTKVNADTGINEENTTVYDDEFLDLKRKYINQLTNIYKEFADKFKECFMIIY